MNSRQEVVLRHLERSELTLTGTAETCRSPCTELNEIRLVLFRHRQTDVHGGQQDEDICLDKGHKQVQSHHRCGNCDRDKCPEHLLQKFTDKHVGIKPDAQREQPEEVADDLNRCSPIIAAGTAIGTNAPNTCSRSLPTNMLA